LEIDSKKSEKNPKKKNLTSDNLADKLCQKLRYLLVEKDDFAEKIVCVGSTSQTEANHARIIRRGYHVKGMHIRLTLFDLS